MKSRIIFQFLLLTLAIPHISSAQDVRIRRPPHWDPGVYAEKITENIGPGMSLRQFKDTAQNNAERCIGGKEGSQCEVEIQYALDKQLMSLFAGTWARENGYYPVIDRNDVIQSVCRCGCFEESTRIMVESSDESGQWIQIPIRNLQPGIKVASLAESSTLSNLETSKHAIKSIVKGREEQDLYVFGLADGRSLKLTRNHGVVLGDGKIVAASEVKAGQTFVDFASGAPITISKISREQSGLVFNFETDAPYDLGHLVVAEGLLVGDLVWQNQKSVELGSILLRR